MVPGLEREIFRIASEKRRPAQGDNWAGRAFDTVVDEARRVGRISTDVD